MKWSWKIGQFLGIGVYIHATFPLLLLFVAIPTLMEGGDWTDVAMSIGFILLLFLCVVLHEYGHALTARRYGIRTQDITLLPIGGVARLERIPEKPTQELVVAIAGPMVNVAIAAALAVVISIAGFALPTLGMGWGQESFLEQLLTVNLVLVLFNLIPAFPMDGGRILRALMAMRLDHARATRYAAYLGQGIAVLFVIAGFFYNPILILTAVFIFMGAQAESQMAQARGGMQGFTAGQAMRTNVRWFTPWDTLGSAMEALLNDAQPDFPVIGNGQVLGMVPREELIRCLYQVGAHAPVRTLMQPAGAVEADQPLTTAMDALQSQGARALAVTRQGGLVGMLTLDSIAEFLRLQQALRRAGGQPVGGQSLQRM